jgi:hypothetical protein
MLCVQRFDGTVLTDGPKTALNAAAITPEFCIGGASARGPLHPSLAQSDNDVIPRRRCRSELGECLRQFGSARWLPTHRVRTT